MARSFAISKMGLLSLAWIGAPGPVALAEDLSAANVFIEFSGGGVDRDMAAVINAFSGKTELMPTHTYQPPETSSLCPILGSQLGLGKDYCTGEVIAAIRALNENASSPLRGEIKLFGVGHGRVAQAALAEELKAVFSGLEALGGRQVDHFRDVAMRFFLNYFRQIARVFPKAWAGRKYSIKTATALRAFVRVVPDVLRAGRAARRDPFEAATIAQVVEPWGVHVGDARFETEGEWREKQAGGTRGTVELLARELRSCLQE